MFNLIPRLWHMGAVAVSLAAVTAAIPAQASSLTITTAGANLGFSLSTFASGFPSFGPGGIGPAGVAVNGNGQVLVHSQVDNLNYVFPDVNGQTTTTAIGSTSFTAFAPAYTNSGGTVYGSGGIQGPYAGSFVVFNNDGTVNQTVPVSTGKAPTYGNWTNPTNGHVIASGTGYLFDFNPGNEHVTVLGPGGSDGLTVSPDGTKIYINDGAIYNIFGTPLGSFGVVDQADGVAVITSGNPAINGNLIVNTNSGNLVMVNLTSLDQTIIANMGSRGDYVAPDFTNGTLFITQSDEVLRLTCGTGCAIGSTPVPEPTSIVLVSLGIIVLGCVRRHARH